ncbi:hypothetical protein PG987_004240 [Apiospora arundinis]
MTEVKDCIIILYGCDARVIFESMHSLSADWIPHVDKEVLIKPNVFVPIVPPCPHQPSFDIDFTFWCIQTRKLQPPCWLAVRAVVDRSLFTQRSRSWARQVQLELSLSEQGQSSWGCCAPASTILQSPLQMHGHRTPDSSQLNDPTICPSYSLSYDANASAQTLLMDAIPPHSPPALGQNVPFQSYLEFGIEAFPNTPIGFPAALVETREAQLRLGHNSSPSHSQEQRLETLAQAEEKPPKRTRGKPPPKPKGNLPPKHKFRVPPQPPRLILPSH